jgi:8-oxo-dGTP diphosphatase
VGEHRQPLECVAALVLNETKVLAEERKSTKRVVPGAVALPGGHVEPGESAEDALRRELKEELGIAPLEVRYVCTLLHRSAEFRKLHYFAVPRWEGTVECYEAASLRWVPLTASHDLDLEVDRLALAEYQRVYRDRRGPGAYTEA